MTKSQHPRTAEERLRLARSKIQGQEFLKGLAAINRGLIDDLDEDRLKARAHSSRAEANLAMKMLGAHSDVEFLDTTRRAHIAGLIASGRDGEGPDLEQAIAKLPSGGAIEDACLALWYDRDERALTQGALAFLGDSLRFLAWEQQYCANEGRASFANLAVLALRAALRCTLDPDSLPEPRMLDAMNIWIVAHLGAAYAMQSIISNSKSGTIEDGARCLEIALEAKPGYAWAWRVLGAVKVLAGEAVSGQSTGKSGVECFGEALTHDTTSFLYVNTGLSMCYRFGAVLEQDEDKRRELLEKSVDAGTTVLIHDVENYTAHFSVARSLHELYPPEEEGKRVSRRAASMIDHAILKADHAIMMASAFKAVLQIIRGDEGVEIPQDIDAEIKAVLDLDFPFTTAETP